MNSTVSRILLIVISILFTLPRDRSCAGDETNNQFRNRNSYTIQNPKMIWGKTTNFIRGSTGVSGLIGNTLAPLPTSLRAGIDVSNGIIVLTGHPLKPLHRANLYVDSVLGQPPWTFPATIEQGVPVVHSPSSTNWVWTALPPPNERLLLEMTTAENAPVPMTAAGRPIGQPITLQPDTLWFTWQRTHRRMMILGKAPSEMMTLDPTPYFKITKPGLYMFTVTLRLYVVDTNTYLKAVSLPPVTVPVRVENN